MCGIGGILRFDDRPIAPERLRAMLARLRHRGPDGEGIAARGRCAMVHARLAILDIPGGGQPMETARRDDSGPLTVVFNGQIYNHRELRRQLESLGHSFASDHADTEVLLHGYRQWGVDLCRRLEGMFALAIWDQASRTLFLARDRMGKKPLWIDTQGLPGEMSFASLPAAILAGSPGSVPGSSSASVDRDALGVFLRLGYTGRQSLLAGIEEVPTATWMLVSVSGRIETAQYWSPPAAAGIEAGADPVAATMNAIAEAVDSRLEADVPLGCFLSGGIDSSIVAALAQRRLRERGQAPLKTFCAKMPAADYDESGPAAVVARHIGSRHEELVIEADPGREFMANLEHLIASSGEATADSSILPTHWVSKAARGHVKAVLSGDGGDELFGGYDRYRAMRVLVHHRWWLSKFPTRPLASMRQRSARTRLRRLVDAAGQHEPAMQYASMTQLFTPRQVHELGVADAGPEGLWGWHDEEADHVLAAMRWDLDHYLPFDLLRKVDRASMAVALEVRCPLLDRRVCDLACSLPTGVLMPGGRPKGLLRQVAARLLPGAIAGRAKRGFGIPLGEWFRGSLREPLAERLFDGSLERLGLASGPVRKMYEEHVASQADHTHRLFAVLSLAVWGRWVSSLSARG